MSDRYDVFLSHSPADESVVAELAKRLKVEAELRPFFREWELIPGESSLPAIERAIELSTTVAVFFGPEGPDAWRDEESQLALIGQADRRIIPVLLSGASKRDVAGFLRTRTWVDITEDNGFERLVAGIKGLAPGLVIGFDPGSRLHRRFGASSESGRRHARVFISSTLCDDRDRRDEVLEAIEMVGMAACATEPIPAGAGASTIAARKQQLEESDLFLMLVAWRYGRIPEGHDRSITELEYEWACEYEIPRIVLLIDEKRPVVVVREFDESDERWTKQIRLQSLKTSLEGQEPTLGFTPENIGAKVTHSLLEWRNYGALGAPRVPTQATPPSVEGADLDPEVPGALVDPPPVESKGGQSKRKPGKARKPRGPRKSGARRVPLHELSQYLETVERESATTSIFGPNTSLEVPLHLDDLRIKVHLAPSRISECSANEDAPDLELRQVFEEAERKGCRGVALVGPPGAGKSTQLRQIALWLSRRSAKTLGLPVDTVPLLLAVHELPADIEDLRDAIAVAVDMGRDTEVEDPWVEALLEREHLLFLVDGFDQLPTRGRRDRVLRWLDEGLRRHPKARILVTQRRIEPGEGEPWSVPLLEVHLPPLERSEARTLVERWSRAVESGDDAAETRAKRQSDALWAELEASEFRTTRMFELTRNPLMLSVFCVVYHERGRLPTRRVELYEQCVQVLVERWCRGGNLPRRFGDREARQVLQPLAYWLHEERGRTYADARSIAVALEPHLGSALGYEIEGESFLRAVSAGDGIMRAKGKDSYGLLHLCFQEYLCARHLRSLCYGDPAVLDRLAKRFGDPWWQEVIRLLLALGEPALFEPLMRRVVQGPAFVEHLDWIVDCMHDAVEGTVEPFVELLEQPPGEQSEFWSRQLAAAQILERVRPERLSALASSLVDHPLEGVRRLAGQGQSSEPRGRLSPRNGYALIEILAGRFTMGSPPRERQRGGHEGPRHEVELSRFFMGKYPVTNEEFGFYLRECPEAREPAYWGDPRYNRPRQPVVGISWREAMTYCAWAGLSLPTESQWEHACRAGTSTAYWSGREERDLVDVGWYADNSGKCLHPVGELEPNPFGLYDVHGNVWEWCLDGFGDYRGHSPRADDGLRHEPLAEGNRVIRGGSFIDSPREARSAYRLNRHADDRLAYLGFRAVELVLP